MLDLIPPPVPSEPERLADSKLEDTAPAAIPSVRLLTEAEIQTLAPVFAEQGAGLPDPATSFFVGSVDGDGVVNAFLVLQLKVHAQPLWIRPGHESVFRNLTSTAEQIVQERTGGNVWIYLFAPAGKLSRMAEVAGMHLEPWNVWSKLVEPISAPVEAKQPEREPSPRPKRVPIWQRDELPSSPPPKQEIQ